MSDMTRLLEAAQAGESRAAADLLPLVYDELRKFASARMAVEAPAATADAVDDVGGPDEGVGRAYEPGHPRRPVAERERPRVRRPRCPRTDSGRRSTGPEVMVGCVPVDRRGLVCPTGYRRVDSPSWPTSHSY